MEFKIPKNHTIYSIYPGETGLPTKVELHKSQNLKDYTLIWPEPLLKISEIGEKIYFYEILNLQNLYSKNSKIS